MATVKKAMKTSAKVKKAQSGSYETKTKKGATTRIDQYITDNDGPRYYSTTSKALNRNELGEINDEKYRSMRSDSLRAKNLPSDSKADFESRAAMIKKYKDEQYLKGRQKRPSGKSYKTGGVVKKAKSGGSFPDLNKDGKVTKADILKGRGVIAKKGASVSKKCKYGCK